MFRKSRGAIVWTLAVTMSLSPAMVYCQAPSTESVKRPIDLGYVTPEAAAAVVVYPRHVLTAPEMEMLPIEVLSAAGKKEFGIDPVQIEQVLVIAEPPQGGPPEAALVVHLAGPLPEGKILGPLWDRTTAAELDGKAYRRGTGPMDLSIFRPDDRTLILATDGLLHRILSNHASPKEGKMSRLLGRIQSPNDVSAVLLVEPIRPLLAGPLAMAPVPPPLAGVKKIPDLVSEITVAGNLVGEPSLRLRVRANDESAAEQLDKIIGDLLGVAKQNMMAQSERMAGSSDPVEQAMARYLQRLNDRMLKELRPVRKGDTLTLAPRGGKDLQLSSVATIGILVALLLPAVHSARSAARRAVSSNNLKQIGLAMHMYASAYNHLPARASFDKQGKPLLSWRVHLLPFIEQDSLYKQFRLDEPWDSEHNRALVAKMPQIFRSPSGNAGPGLSHYLGVSGKGLALDGAKELKFSDIRDGTSNTILAVEVDDAHAVTWTKPDDWQYDPQQPLAGLSTVNPQGFSVLFSDGSVRSLSKSIDPKVFHALLTIAGGEVIPPGDY